MLQVLSTAQKAKIIEPITPTFEIATFYDQDNHGGDAGSYNPTYWKLKKTRNGCKGRTMKHPFNAKKKQLKNTSVFKPSAC